MKTVTLRFRYETVFIAVTCTNTTPRGDTSILTMQLTNILLRYRPWMVVAMIATTIGN